MKTLVRVLMATVLSAVLMVGTAFGGPYGTDITVPDLMNQGSGWWGAHEDQEVEPGDSEGQVWDLEGFFLNGTKLTMIGGYDFKNGVGDFASGDIFIDVNGDAKYGPGTGGGFGNTIVTNTFGYDYVFDLDFAAMTYNLVAIDSRSTVKNVYYEKNQGSNPWRYDGGGTVLASGAITYTGGLTDAQTGFQGGTHNAATVDLSPISSAISDGFIAHFTMQCGNDDLMGGTPEPATVVLLGLGLLGVITLRMRKKFGR